MAAGAQMRSNALEHVCATKPVWHHDRTIIRGSRQSQKAKANETTRVVGYNVGK